MTVEQNYIPGKGKESVVPKEIDKWNWGAFLLNWICDTYGKAVINYKITGPKGEGTTYVAAEKILDKWNIKELFVYFEETGQKINIKTTRNQ